MPDVKTGIYTDVQWPLAFFAAPSGVLAAHCASPDAGWILVAAPVMTDIIVSVYLVVRIDS